MYAQTEGTIDNRPLWYYTAKPDESAIGRALRLTIIFRKFVDD